MSQKTAKTVEDVIRWVETNAHHRAAWVQNDAFLVLSGDGSTLRIPRSVQERTHGLIKPGDIFDTRMYRATEAGLELLAKEPTT